MENIEHISRIRKVLDYIENNLEEELKLETLAKEGYYSPFHFHRIFKAVIGETLQEYILRKRMEKSANLLSQDKYRLLQEIYLETGFKSHSTFSKTFKKYFGTTPTHFRKITPENFSKILKINSNNGQSSVVFEQYICNVKQIQNIMQNAKIEIKQMPEMHLASVTSIGVQNVEKAFEKVIHWGKSKNLFPAEHLKMISVYHDSFKLTSPDKVRINACMLLDKPIKSEGEIFPEKLPAGKYIVGNFFIGLEEFEQAWNGLFMWMNEKGYEFRRVFPYEIYHTNLKDHQEGKMNVDLCIPIN